MLGVIFYSECTGCSKVVLVTQIRIYKGIKRILQLLVYVHQVIVHG